MYSLALNNNLKKNNNDNKTINLYALELATILII